MIVYRKMLRTARRALQRIRDYEPGAHMIARAALEEIEQTEAHVGTSVTKATIDKAIEAVFDSNALECADRGWIAVVSCGNSVIDVRKLVTVVLEAFTNDGRVEVARTDR